MRDPLELGFQPTSAGFRPRAGPDEAFPPADGLEAAFGFAESDAQRLNTRSAATKLRDAEPASLGSESQPTHSSPQPE